MIRTMRWISVIPSAIAGYFLAFLMVAISYEVAESFCPNSQFVSEHCFAPYMKSFESISVVVFPTIVAVLVVLLPYWCAPRHKSIVALSYYFCGLIVAVYFTLNPQLWLTLFAAAASAGLLVLTLVHEAKLITRPSTMPAKNAGGWPTLRFGRLCWWR